MPKLTEKQKRFVQEYLVDLNATAAAKRAGYSAKTADRIGPELLGKTCVSEAILRFIGQEVFLLRLKLMRHQNVCFAITS